MKPQASAFLDKARELLDRADTMLGVGLNEDAGRTAYLAGLHAAQALIFETTGRVFKKHPTVQGEFGRLVKDEPRVDADLRAFLGRTYSLKAIADYETGPRLARVGREGVCRDPDRAPLCGVRHDANPPERSRAAHAGGRTEALTPCSKFKNSAAPPVT